MKVLRIASGQGQQFISGFALPSCFTGPPYRDLHKSFIRIARDGEAV